MAVPYLEDAVRALRELGAEVVVGTCPDLGTIRPLAQPLRAYARRLSRTHGRGADRRGRAGRRADRLARRPAGPLFFTRREMFSDDLFHPSAEGYAEAAQRHPALGLDALGLRTRSPLGQRVHHPARQVARAGRRPGRRRTPAPRSPAPSASAAAENRKGPLAQLRRRVPRAAASDTAPRRGGTID